MLIKEVTLDRSSRKADSSVSMTFVTNTEQDTKSFGEIDELRKQSGHLVFKPSGRLTDKEIVEIEKVQLDVEGKTHRERLRNVLWVAWDQSDSKKEFKDFYADWYEQQIQLTKDRLT